MAQALTAFTSPRWLSGRHAQTIYGSLVRWPPRLTLARERWELPDGDFVDVDRLPGPHADAPVVIVCHGLEGSSRSGYVRGLLAELGARGLGAVALNFRGCSGELNRLARFYHSGDTGDLAHVVERLRAERPGRRLGLAGFSLGGNVVAKYLGERGAGAAAEIAGAVVVSVPFDLALCAGALDGPGLFNWIYRERFLRRLRNKARAKARHFPAAIDVGALGRARSFREFDGAVTAPLHGFASAEDYWSRSSSAAYLEAVRRPLLVIAAEDDPFVPAAALPRADTLANPLVTLAISARGGHVGFVTGAWWRPRRWAERHAAEFLAGALG